MGNENEANKRINLHIKINYEIIIVLDISNSIHRFQMSIKLEAGELLQI